MGTAKGQAAVASPLSQSSQDAAWRHTGKVMGVPKFGGERVTIGSARTARDAVLVTTGKLGGGFPRPIVGHRTFDREDMAAVVGDDQEERLAFYHEGRYH